MRAGLDAGGASDPRFAWNGGASPLRAERCLQPKVSGKFQPGRLMHATFQLKQLAMAFDLPKAIALENFDTERFRFVVVSMFDVLVKEWCSSFHAVHRMIGACR